MTRIDRLGLLVYAVHTEWPVSTLLGPGILSEALATRRCKPAGGDSEGKARGKEAEPLGRRVVATVRLETKRWGNVGDGSQRRRVHLHKI